MKKQRLTQKVADLLDAPVSAISGSFMEFFSNTQATVEGCKGILEYDGSCIKLVCCDLCVCFRGEGLYIRSMTDSSATVCGLIASVDFSLN